MTYKKRKNTGIDHPGVFSFMNLPAFPEGRLPCVKSKACEARPVDDEASKVWRCGQNIQGECRRIFWAPQEFAPDEVG
ncbi:MAG: hypothetical protein IIV40_03385 [Oscillospiraceae bacterium]|nr:hypothetical protein [Oscillospiraceae bacterium]